MATLLRKVNHTAAGMVKNTRENTTMEAVAEDDACWSYGEPWPEQ
jgi:hypothetical protein